MAPDADVATSLRERKKLETRRSIHRAALELAIARGPNRVTIDDIAESVGISPRTFFNYFATKEQAFVGLGPDLAAEVSAALHERPDDESITDSVHAVFAARLAVLAEDVESWRLRMELAGTAPELANAMFGSTARMERAVVAVAVERAGHDGLDVVMPAFQAMGVIRAVLWVHVGAGLTGDLLERLEEAFAKL
ncbi:TetR/AcrR family transcriptional regulator [Cumulibacter soli]|uniref:TetR/AcrR family transcriptional regulator n=1 Tax=Cumulibacter soli TaxID=2546344 RepID=UPI00141934BC|nr:TetR/AcrR family transcriptional regulator [Cumulibacter soli]